MEGIWCIQYIVQVHTRNTDTTGTVVVNSSKQYYSYK